MGVNYWSPWRDEDFEKEHGFISGALGPTYGHQLRAFGHPYGNGYFSGPGLNDQLLTLIDNIKKDPTDRGHIINLWNPAQIPLMKLRPCLYGYQFGVDSQGNMDLMINQRSADVPVGVPANLFFSTCFLYMVAQQTGYKPRNLIHSIADAHIYDNQIDAVKEYLGRTSPPDPNLTINKAADILSYKIEDFELENYNPLPPIKFEVAI
jgi:thymidylate synthase